MTHQLCLQHHRHKMQRISVTPAEIRQSDWLIAIHYFQIVGARGNHLFTKLHCSTLYCHQCYNLTSNNAITLHLMSFKVQNVISQQLIFQKIWRVQQNICLTLCRPTLDMLCSRSAMWWLFLNDFSHTSFPSDNLGIRISSTNENTAFTHDIINNQSQQQKRAENFYNFL